MMKKTRTIFNLHSFFLSIISFRHLRRTLATRIKHKKKKKKKRKFGTISVNIKISINIATEQKGEKRNLDYRNFYCYISISLDIYYLILFVDKRVYFISFHFDLERERETIDERKSIYRLSS